MYGFVLFIIIVAVGFPITGVIALLVKNSHQAETLREYGRRISLLEENLRTFKPAPAEAAREKAATAAPDSATAALVAVATRTAAPAAPPAQAPTPAAPVPTPAAVPVPAAKAAAPVPTPAAAPAQTPAPPAPSSAAGKALAAFIRRGNLWAAGGILLLLAGFAALITYLASRGFFTVEMGIAAAALAGLAMLAAGWRFRKKRPVYFLLLQGGGIGILYLSVFAAHKLTPWFPPLLTLILMGVLILPALVLALFQNSQALALLGFLGGFAAPLLLASGEGNHVFLFAWYGVLNLGILFISLFRFWKGLNILAFLCTFILANYWTVVYYTPPLFWQAEPFFLGYILIFTLLGIHGFGRTRNGKNPLFSQNPAGVKEPHPPVDLTLTLGTPLMGALLQWQIFETVPHGYAIICLGFSAFYLLLALIIRKRGSAGRGIFPEAWLGFAALLANLAVPLELAPRITSAVWAAEGLLVFFFGLRLDRFRVIITGLVFHVAAAAAFAFEQDLFFLNAEGPFRSARFIGSLIIAISALAIIFFAEHPPGHPLRIRRLYPAFPFVLGIWAFLWWFGGWTGEIIRIDPGPGVLFLVYTASALAAFGAAKLFRCPVYRLGMIPVLGLSLILIIQGIFSGFPLFGSSPAFLSYNFFHGLYRWGWTAFFITQALFLFLTRKKMREEIHSLWMLLVTFTALIVLSSSGRALTLLRELAPAWTSLAGMAPVFAAMIGAGFLARRVYPAGKKVGFREGLFFFVFPLILSCVMGLWFFVTLFLSGDPAPLPFYIPLINPLDLEEAFCIVLFVFWQSVLGNRQDLPRMHKGSLFVLTDALIFLFAAAVAARSVHFYGGIPYGQVFHSGPFQLCLFILWALYGIGHIIGGHRLSLRKVWIAGAVLTVADIAKFLLFDLAETGAITRTISFFIAGILFLFIGWAAPLPPAKAKGKTISPDTGQDHET
ncbi:MAG: DUF2339 domain-containing protein [Treponema sp.]|jgi:uncharacterized membrane protein|nr:DUF2339 domain-containing protein [Treponema sp.]